MRSVVYAFAIDLLDEGADAVCKRVAQRAQADAITVTAAYHAARDLLPHNPRRSIAYQESGAVYFEPTWDLYPSDLRPYVARDLASRDMFGELRLASSRYGLDLGAWIVFLHNTRLASDGRHAIETALGVPLGHVLCPARPEVRAYCLALATDVAAFEPSAIHLESLNPLPFDHGGHHERVMIDLGEIEKSLLGVCFCSACRQAGEACGVDAAAVRERVAAHLRFVFETSDPDLIEERRSVLRDDRSLSDYLTVRRAVISRLITDVAGVIRATSPGTAAVLIDVSGALALGGTSRAVDLARRDGLDLSAATSAVDRISVTGYVEDQNRLESELQAYVAAIEEPRQLEVIVRPAPPENETPDELRARVRLVESLGIEHVGFYNYGLLRLEALDWIRAALE